MKTIPTGATTIASTTSKHLHYQSGRVSRQDVLLDETLQDTFPVSDPVSIDMIRLIKKQRQKNHAKKMKSERG